MHADRRSHARPARSRRRANPWALGVVVAWPLLALMVGSASVWAEGGLWATGRPTGQHAAPAAATATPAASAPVHAATITDSRQCASCHQFTPSASHPVGVRPTMAVPASMPLTGERVDCLTCHDAALASGHEARAAQGRDFLRSADQPGNWCASCHTAPSKGHAAHAAAPGVRVHAPLRAPSRQIDRPARAQPEGGTILPVGHTLDAESRACMACHDGTTASDVGSRHQISRAGAFASDHPVGGHYDHARTSEGEPMPLRPRASLDPRVRLFNGQLGCGSCHNVYAQ